MFGGGGFAALANRDEEEKPLSGGLFGKKEDKDKHAGFFGSPAGNAFAKKEDGDKPTGLGMFVALLFKDKDQGSNIINIMIPIFTLISGGFTAIDADGALKTVQYLTPNYHFHQVMLNYVFNISSDVVVSSITTLWVMIAICYSGAIILKGRTL